MGFGRGKGQEGRGKRGGAHQGLDLGGEDLGEGARRRGWSSGRRQWRTEFCSSISAGERLEQVRDGTEWGRGEVAQLGVRRIEAGWRAVAGATNGGDSSSCSAQQLGKGIGMD